VLARNLITISLATLFAISLAACFSGATPPRDLLLDSSDFPSVNVTEIVQETGTTNEDEPAVQVKLLAPDFTVLESLVLFETRDLALGILAGIKQDQTAQGVVPVPIEGFQDNAGVLGEHLNGEETSTVFFVEGRALVRISVQGENGVENIWEIARRARIKSGG
jgi:hypothetical protein